MSDSTRSADDSDSTARRPRVIGRRDRDISERVHVATLRAQVEQIERERDRLAEQVDGLEAEQSTLKQTVEKQRTEIEQLQARCEALEATVAYKDQQRQQVIESYECRLADSEQSSPDERWTSRLLESLRGAHAGLRRGVAQCRAVLGRFGVT